MSEYNPTLADLRQHIDAEAQLLGLTPWARDILWDMVRAGSGPKLRGLLCAMEAVNWKPPADMEAA